MRKMDSKSFLMTVLEEQKKANSFLRLKSNIDDKQARTKLINELYSELLSPSATSYDSEHVKGGVKKDVADSLLLFNSKIDDMRKEIVKSLERSTAFLFEGLKLVNKTSCYIGKSILLGRYLLCEDIKDIANKKGISVSCCYYYHNQALRELDELGINFEKLYYKCLK